MRTAGGFDADLTLAVWTDKSIKAMMIKFTTAERNEDANPATSDSEYVAPLFSILYYNTQLFLYNPSCIFFELYLYL